MSGSKRLSAQEVAEMRDDAKSAARRQAFKSARMASQNGDLDGYIEFLSQTLPLINRRPETRITKNNKL